MITPSFFNPFSLFDQEFPSLNALRVRPEDNFGLQSFRRDPFFSDFFGQVTPFEDMISRISPFSSGSSSVHEMIENFRKKMEEEVKVFEELEKNPPQLEDPEHTSCFMRVMTNDNGHVKVKTMKKTPETEWETRVDEYQPSLENKENEENVQIEDETEQKQKQIQGSSDSQ